MQDLIRELRHEAPDLGVLCTEYRDFCSEGVPPSGVLSSARGADADKGRLIFETITSGLAEATRTALT